MARKHNEKKKPQPGIKPFLVTVANDLSEYAVLRCFTRNADEAEKLVEAMLGQGKLSALPYKSGDDREGPYVSDVDNDAQNQLADAIIKNGKILPPEPFKLQCRQGGYDGGEESP